MAGNKPSKALSSTLSTVHPSEQKLSQENQPFCQRCSKFAAKLELHLPTSNPTTAMKSSFFEEIETVKGEASKACPLCKFWSHIRHPGQHHLHLSAYREWHSGQSPEARHLFCEEPLFKEKLKLFSLTILQKMYDPVGNRPSTQTGKLIQVCGEQKSWLRPLNSQKIDFGTPRKWLEECKAMHIQCSKGKRNLIPGMKLIDCRTRRIVADSLFDYVALSYIWGPPTEPNSDESKVSDFNEELLGPLPETIENAMQVTEEMGFRYLWIDKYCIQQDSPNFLSQIGQMDSIYANADLTIIALGHDPSHGLPGVQSRNRHPQHSAEIGKYNWIYTNANPQEEIKSSKWMTRAWTYQEALLSKRRLFFTDHELYFECRNFFRSEAFDFPLDLLDLDDSLFSSDGKGIFPNRGVGDVNRHVLSRISEYSTRKLSYESDILNGFLGMFRVFSTLGVRHHWGIPFSSPLSHHIPPPKFLDPPYRELSFVEGLCWALAPRNMEERLKWVIPGAERRRSGFPSWSWAGWFGEVNWFVISPSFEQMDKQIDVKIEKNNGSLISLEEFVDKSNMVREEVSSYIHISAYISSPTLEELCPGGLGEDFSAMEKGVGDGRLFGIHFLPEGEVEKDEEGFVKYPLLLVRDLGGWMERVDVACRFKVGICERKTWGTVRLG